MRGAGADFLPGMKNMTTRRLSPQKTATFLACAWAEPTYSTGAGSHPPYFITPICNSVHKFPTPLVKHIPSPLSSERLQPPYPLGERAVDNRGVDRGRPN